MTDDHCTTVPAPAALVIVVVVAAALSVLQRYSCGNTDNLVVIVVVTVAILLQWENITFASHGFIVTAPSVWNSLPSSIRT